MANGGGYATELAPNKPRTPTNPTTRMMQAATTTTSAHPAPFDLRARSSSSAFFFSSKGSFSQSYSSCFRAIKPPLSNLDIVRNPPVGYDTS